MCGELFQNAAAFGSHLSKVHAQGSAIGSIGGTSCEVCMKDFFSTKRLHLHLRKTQTCKRVYLESDVDVDGPRGKGSVRAWQPATRVQGPANCWAHLRPVARGERVEEGRGQTYVRILLALARSCPSSNDARRVAVFTKRCFKGFASILSWCSCEPDDLHGCADDLPIGTPCLTVIVDVITCFVKFSDSDVGSFEGEAWCFRWRGSLLLVAPRGTCLSEEFLCL